MQNKDYSKLGGWLLFYFVSLCLGAGVAVLSVLQSLTYINYVFRAGMSALMRLFVLNIGSALLLVYTIVYLYKRNPKFLRFYEISICMGIIDILLSGQFVFFNIILSLIGPICWRVYFHKSARVKVYMGGDDFLRQSIISKFVSYTSNATGVGNYGNYSGQDNYYGDTAEKGLNNRFGEVGEIEPDDICKNCASALRQESVFCP